MDSAHSHTETNSMVGPSVSEAMVLEARTFCVVCGRFGSDFVLRKSGLKCNGCVGKTANKAWARLQQRQANELLSQATTRARMGSTSSVISGLGEPIHWANFSAMDSEEAESVPPEKFRRNGSTLDAQMSSLPHAQRRMPPATPRVEDARDASNPARQPHIRDYISNTACYQAAAAGILVKDATCLTSNATDSLTLGTNEDSYLNDAATPLVSPTAASAPRRRAPAVPPRARAGKSCPKSTDEVGGGGLTNEPGKRRASEQKETPLPLSEHDPSSASSPRKACDGVSSKGKRAQARETAVVDASYAIDCSGAEGDEAGSADKYANTEGPLALPPLLQSDSCYAPPKTPRADDFMMLADASSDTMMKDDTYELRKSAAPAHASIHDGRMRVSASSQSFCTTSSVVRQETVKTKATNRSVAQPASGPSSASVPSSAEGTRPTTVGAFAPSKGGSDANKRCCSRRTSALPAPAAGRPRAHRRQRQGQDQGSQVKLCLTCHVDPASRSFGRCEITSCDALQSSSVFSSSSSSSSLSCLEQESSRAGDASQERDLPAEVTSQRKLSLDNVSGPVPSCVNIDRLYIKVEVPQAASPDDLLLSPTARCLPPAYPATAAAPTTGPVPSAPGSKFTVTRHFSSSNRCHENTSSSTASRSCPDHKSDAVTGGGEDTSQRASTRRRSSAFADRVEAKKIAFILRLHDRDSREELYSVKCHYFSDLVPLFQELKSLMNTLPHLPVLRIPSVRYVPESYVAERREECQTFLDAVVQNHFLIRHPKMVGLLRLEPYLNQQMPLGGSVNLGILGPGESLASAATKIGRRHSVTLFTELNESALEQLRAMSSTNRLGRQMSTSSCMSTTSSVARRGAIDAIMKEDLEKVQLGNLIGRGTFGAVYLGLLPGRSTVVAVKIVKVNENVDEDVLHSMQKELDVLRAARHTNIIRFLGSTYLERERELRVFTEYVECGNISTMVKKFGSLPLLVIQKYMIQILRGLHYLHNMAIVHRDIKGENILITKKGRCKLADFGCSGTLHEVEGREEMQGSPLWMAPEIIHGAPPATAGDIWALGCVGIEMLQRPIWNIAGDLNPYIFLYRIGKVNGPPHGLPTEEEVEQFGRREDTQEEYVCFGLYRNFLCDCLRMNPEERLSAEDLLKHPFLQKPLSKHLRWTPPKVVEEKPARTVA